MRHGRRMTDGRFTSNFDAMYLYLSATSGTNPLCVIGISLTVNITLAYYHKSLLLIPNNLSDASKTFSCVEFCQLRLHSYCVLQPRYHSLLVEGFCLAYDSTVLFLVMSNKRRYTLFEVLLRCITPVRLAIGVWTLVWVKTSQQGLKSTK